MARLVCHEKTKENKAPSKSKFVTSRLFMCFLVIEIKAQDNKELLRKNIGRITVKIFNF